MPGMLNRRERSRVTIECADGGRIEFGMVACCHCGGHFPAPRFGSSEADKASRIGRGWCDRCNDYICGAGCLKCVPLEQYLENLEKGRDPEFVPIVVPVYFPELTQEAKG